MKYFYILLLIFNPLNLFANIAIDSSCQNLIKALELNTGSYNECLFSKAGEKYTAEELKACQSYYLNEVERLSYVFKNICK